MSELLRSDGSAFIKNRPAPTDIEGHDNFIPHEKNILEKIFISNGIPAHKDKKNLDKTAENDRINITEAWADSTNGLGEQIRIFAGRELSIIRKTQPNPNQKLIHPETVLIGSNTELQVNKTRLLREGSLHQVSTSKLGNYTGEMYNGQDSSALRAHPTLDKKQVEEGVIKQIILERFTRQFGFTEEQATRFFEANSFDLGIMSAAQRRILEIQKSHPVFQEIAARKTSQPAPIEVYNPNAPLKAA